MLKPLDFIATARDLAGANSKGRTRETNIRRAVSTTYYALFHCLATSNANMLVGGPGAHRSQPAWRQAYRALQHGTARQRCERQGIIIKFPDETGVPLRFTSYLSELTETAQVCENEPKLH